MKVFTSGRGSTTLTQAHFLSRGGQGAVYVRDGVAFKIYHDPALALPQGKLDELARVDQPWFVRPETLLRDGGGAVVGYRMPFLPDHHVLCRLFTRVFRERHGLTPAMAFALVQQMQRRIEVVHAAGMLIVDLNELNFLVDARFQELRFIDVDSYATPSYPATAVMDSVRDRLSTQFSQASDWFSFAVVSFQLMVGVHPFRGRHPTVGTLDARMQQSLSVLGPDVTAPRVCYPLDVIPPDYLAWYHQVFEHGERCPPPTGGVAPAFHTPVVTLVTGKGVVELDAVATYASAPRSVAMLHGTRFALGPLGLHNENGWTPSPSPPSAVLGITPSSEPVWADIVDGKLAVWSTQGQQALSVEAEEVMSANGTLYFRAGGSVYRVHFHKVGAGLMASARVAANVLPHGTRCYPGVAIQSLLGRHFASMFPEPDRCRQVPLPELDGRRVIDAAFERGVLMVVAEHEGHYEQWVFRFDKRYARHDARVAVHETAVQLNFAVLDTGVCAHLREDDRLELFRATPFDSAVKAIDDDQLGGHLRLMADGGALMAVHDTVVYRVRLTP